MTPRLPRALSEKALSLLEGQDRRHRAAMIGLLEDVHMAKGNAKSFDNRFAQVDMVDLQRRWKSFALSMSIRSE